MKFESKADFENRTATAWAALWQQVQSFDDAQLTDALHDDATHTSTGKDILAHVYAWHLLLLDWMREGNATGSADMPAPGYNWRQTRELNAVLFEEHRETPLASVRRRLKLSHNRVMKTVDGLSETEFLEKSHFKWTGSLAVSSYVAPNTLSHYRWATKKIKAIKG